MADADVELVKRLFDGFEQVAEEYWERPRSLAAQIESGDLTLATATTWRMLATDVVWVTGIFGTRTGHREMAEALDELYEIADDYRVKLFEIEDCDDGVVFVAVDRTITGKGSGIHTTIPMFCVITVRDELVTRIDEYLDRHEAEAAAGMEGAEQAPGMVRGNAPNPDQHR